MGRDALPPVGGMVSVETSPPCFCSLIAFRPSSEGQNKNGDTQISGPEQRNCSLLSSLNPPGQSLFLCAPPKTASSHSVHPLDSLRCSPRGLGVSLFPHLFSMHLLLLSSQNDSLLLLISISLRINETKLAKSHANDCSEPWDPSNCPVLFYVKQLPIVHFL